MDFVVFLMFRNYLMVFTHLNLQAGLPETPLTVSYSATHMAHAFEHQDHTAI